MSAEDHEELRLAVREFLHARQGTAHTAKAIHRRVSTELGFKTTLEDVEAALEFWRSTAPPQVLFDFEEAGSTKWWRITAAGTIAHERR